MTYRELIENPVDGIYKSTGSRWILVDGARIIHSPTEASFKDDEEIEIIQTEDDAQQQYQVKIQAEWIGGITN